MSFTFLFDIVCVNVIDTTELLLSFKNLIIQFYENKTIQLFFFIQLLYQ